MPTVTLDPKVAAGVLVGEGVIHKVGEDHRPLCRPRTSKTRAWCRHLGFLLCAGWCPHCWRQP